MAKLRKGTLQYDILRAMFFLTSCWEKDIKLIVKQKYTDAALTNCIARMVKDEYLMKLDYADKKKSGRYPILYITSKGRRALADMSEESYFYDDYHYKYYDRKFPGYRTTADDQLFRRMTGNRARAMFEAAGVRTFAADKPTLYRLFYRYLPVGDPRWQTYNEEYCHDSYYAEMSDEEIDNAMNDLEGGFYYTSDEYRKMLDQIASNTSDTIRGSRFRGLYFNSFTCLPVYIQEPGKKGMIGIVPDTENKLVSSVTAFARSCIPNVFRKISDIGITEHSVNTLIISNGYAMIYSMVTGYRNGIIKAATNGRELVKAHKSNKRLMFGDARFPRLFVTPANAEGVESLYYLTHNRTERWISDTKEIMKRINTVNKQKPENGMFNELPPGSGIYVGVFQKTINWAPITANVLYMPVCEVNALRQVSANGPDAAKNIVIITNTSYQKVDAIDHCLRKAAIYYDEEQYKEIYYDSDSNRLITLDSEEYNAMSVVGGLNLDDGLGFTYTDEELEAVKKVLKENGSVEDIRDELEMAREFEKLSGKPIPRKNIPLMIQTYGYNGKPIDEELGNEPERKGKASKPPVSSICLYVGAENLKEIKRAANSLDKSVSRYCAEILVEHSRKLNEENRKKKLEEMRVMRQLR